MYCQSNLNNLAFDYKSLKYYFESVINLYKNKYRNEPIDDFLKKTLFCGLFNDANLPDVNYIKGGRCIKRTHTKRIKHTQSKQTKRRFKWPNM